MKLNVSQNQINLIRTDHLFQDIPSVPQRLHYIIMMRTIIFILSIATGFNGVHGSIVSTVCDTLVCNMGYKLFSSDSNHSKI